MCYDQTAQENGETQMISLILAAVIAANPCMIPHKHKPHEPVQSCTVPKPIILPCPAPEAPIEPIELPPMRYYVPVFVDAPAPITADDSPTPMWDTVSGWFGDGPWVSSGPPHIGGNGGWHRAPEIDPQSAGSAVTLLLAALAILRGR